MDEFRKQINSAMGGVLFIDEAYELDPVSDLKGKPVVNELLVSHQSLNFMFPSKSQQD